MKVRRVVVVLTAALLALGLAGVAVADDPGTDPVPVAGCAAPSEDVDLELGTDLGAGAFRTTRVGQHDCFDRVVFHVDGPPANGVRVKYVPELLADASGEVVPVPESAAILQVIVPHFPKLSQAAKFQPGEVAVHQSLQGFDAIRAVIHGGCFEGQCTLGIGTRERLPFRAFTLPPQHGNRGLIVVDIAHQPVAPPG